MTQTTSHPILEEIGARLAARWWAVVLRGVFAIVFAFIAFFAPGATMLSLVYVFAAYAFVDGVVALWSVWPASRARMNWGPLALEGVVNIVAAAAALAWPGLTVTVFVLMIAVWAIVSGILMFAAAFRMPFDYGQSWLVLGGLVSVLYGVVLFVAPMNGAVVLTWWIGAYALVFGVSLIVLSVRLRGLVKK